MVSQRKYVLNLFKETGMLGCKLVDTLIEITTKDRGERKSVLANKGIYQGLVRKFIYLSYTIPDIGFVVSVASQFMNNPSDKLMNDCITF